MLPRDDRPSLLLLLLLFLCRSRLLLRRLLSRLLLRCLLDLFLSLLRLRLLLLLWLLLLLDDNDSDVLRFFEGGSDDGDLSSLDLFDIKKKTKPKTLQIHTQR